MRPFSRLLASAILTALAACSKPEPWPALHATAVAEFDYETDDGAGVIRITQSCHLRKVGADFEDRFYPGGQPGGVARNCEAEVYDGPVLPDGVTIVSEPQQELLTMVSMGLDTIAFAPEHLVIGGLGAGQKGLRFENETAYFQLRDESDPFSADMLRHEFALPLSAYRSNPTADRVLSPISLREIPGLEEARFTGARLSVTRADPARPLSEFGLKGAEGRTWRELTGTEEEQRAQFEAMRRELIDAQLERNGY